MALGTFGRYLGVPGGSWAGGGFCASLGCPWQSLGSSWGSLGGLSSLEWIFWVSLNSMGVLGVPLEGLGAAVGMPRGTIGDNLLRTGDIAKSLIDYSRGLDFGSLQSLRILSKN